ncbi:hypothetical protein AVEN_4367-1 [Araneus ventricosus]|uniref:BESS domain-containing protein n=1 Tax=Araneus ventricosus TaxID=182803 RepID=A0A4Y2MR24_ARAVE|nr:hypothetical protein AVEN_4367-1 [Araneus ventricosus]
MASSYGDLEQTPSHQGTHMKLENEPDSIECDQLHNDVETPDVVDQVESPGINSISQVEESYETAVNEGGPPASKKRKAALVENRMNEAYLLLKQVASKPKVAKDESQLFCDLLCLKLRALDEDTRERAMYEMNNLMFRFKHQASNIPSTPIPYQQPGYFPAFSPQWHGMNNHQLPNYGFHENSFSHLSPAHTLTSSAPQHNVNNDQREGHDHIFVD